MHGAVLLLISVALWLVEASVYLVVGDVVGIQLGATGALYVMALTNLSAVVPAAPGYVGTFDAAVLLALRSLHQPALGYLLVLRFVLFVPVTVAGFAVFVGQVRAETHVNAAAARLRELRLDSFLERAGRCRRCSSRSSVSRSCLRSSQLGQGFWIDEGISVGIAHHHWSSIPHVLRQDGSPPALLHAARALDRAVRRQRARDARALAALRARLHPARVRRPRARSSTA